MTVTAIEIASRRPIADGRSLGPSGSYEELRGTLRFAVDPKHPDHQVITDIGLAPTEADGRVAFSSDFLLLKPTQPSPGGSLLYDVVNRGNRTALGTFNDAEGDRTGSVESPGNGFLFQHGFSVVFCGWQHDVPNGLALHAPEAREAGERLKGQAFIQYQLSVPAPSLLLSDAGHKPLPAADLEDAKAMLTVRDHPDGSPRTIPRAQWRFARQANGQVVSDENHVWLEGGFQPGLVYEIIYTTVGAPVIGLGFLAMRDCVSFLKYGTSAEGNPSAGSLSHAYGHGRSQSGRVLREFCYLGLNRDESEQLVFDGMMIHTGSSRRGEFNLRFGQPSTNIMRSPSVLFPMTYTAQDDPETGEKGGLLTRLQERNAVPKIIATNTGVEYWWSGASLAHTDVEGTRDVPPPPEVRIYHLAGTQHGQGSPPLTDRTVDGSRLQYPLNTVDYRPLLRAALLNLDHWARGGAEPPPSQYPRIENGTAVRRESLSEAFERIPGVKLPVALPLRRRLDFGPGVSRGVFEYPPEEGPAFGTLVSAVDEDGNEVAGVRGVDLRAPLATYTGWTRRHADIGAEGHFIPLLGATHVLPRNAAQRAAAGDPRASVEERYGTREAYLERARAAAQELVAEGYLLADEVEHVVAQAAARYDAFFPA
jgi:hypothetical protein